MEIRRISRNLDRGEAMFLLDNIVVVITGAAGGLGRAVAWELHRRGCRLSLVDINADGLERLRMELEVDGGPDGEVQIGSRHLTHCIDIADEAAVKQMAAEVLAGHGRVDWLINNAAISISQPFVQLQLEDLRRLFAVNYWGTVHCTKCLLPHLKGNDSRLVNVVSGFALMGFPGKSSYGSSKGAITSFSYALRTELAGSGVRVCLVIPPPMNTGIVRGGQHIDAEKQAREVRFLERNGMPLGIAARRIVRGIRRGHFRIIIDMRTYFMDAACRLFPTWVHGLIGRRRDRIDFF
jgi:NAD(P)-dependent dehydrogenase (short-subunit alcohol dehydrogenase family)